MNDIFYREIKMPLTIRGFTKLDENGDYNVYINKDLSEFTKRKTIRHENQHIQNDDFYNDDLSVAEKEKRI